MASENGMSLVCFHELGHERIAFTANGREHATWYPHLIALYRDSSGYAIEETRRGVSSVRRIEHLSEYFNG